MGSAWRGGHWRGRRAALAAFRKERALGRAVKTLEARAMGLNRVKRMACELQLDDTVTVANQTTRQNILEKSAPFPRARWSGPVLRRAPLLPGPGRRLGPICPSVFRPRVFTPGRHRLAQAVDVAGQGGAEVVPPGLPAAPGMQGGVPGQQ